MTYSDYSPGLQNIGDYIQSLAASQFLSPNPTHLNRESLNTYSGETVQLIMNGWFMHNPENFPPSNRIDPLFVGFHIANQCKERLLTTDVIEYLKKHGPIGCRDKRTQQYLMEEHIPCYFSGCLTLTLGLTYQNKPEERDNKIYIVDPYIQWRFSLPIVCEILKTSIKKYKLIQTISKKLKNKHCDNILPKKYQNVFGSWIYATMIYKIYSSVIDEDVLADAEYVTHIIRTETLPTDSDKFQYADGLLQKYSRASMVITSRLHCALPCLAMETPCIFATSETLRSDGRFEGLQDLLYTISYEPKIKAVSCDQLTQEINITKIHRTTKIIPKQNHLDIRDVLISTCNEFIQK